MPKVIVNSTPIIALAKIHHLDLLHEMYGDITIPEAVYREVTEKNDEVREQITARGWIHVEAVKHTENRAMYKAKLHDGEVEVMILAQEYGSDHKVIIDDDSARKTAIYLGLNLTGTLGVLIKAKQCGFIQNVMTVVAEMEAHKIYFSERLKNMIRNVSGE